jgi:hypothetical protein
LSPERRKGIPGRKNVGTIGRERAPDPSETEGRSKITTGPLNALIMDVLMEIKRDPAYQKPRPILGHPNSQFAN